VPSSPTRPLPSRSPTAQSDRRADPPGLILSEAPSAPTGLLRDILASHPSAVVLVDSSGKIVFANPHTSELTGYAEDELNGIPVDKLVPEQLRRGHRQNRESYLAAPETRPMGLGRDLHVRHKDGHLVPVEIGLSSFVSEGRRYVVAILADITARKQMEKELRRTTADLEALIAASPLATVVLDLEGDVRLWNPAAEYIFGWTAAEVVGKRLPHVPKAEMAEMRQVLLGVARGEVIGGMHLRRTRKDGHPIQIELFAAPQRDHDGRTVGVIEQMADVTARQHMEETLLQAQKMESIGRLAGGIAHDFNNMLTAVSGFAQLLLLDLPEDSPQHESAEAIRRAAEQAAALTQQLLAFSRRQMLQPTVLDPDEIVAGMEPMLRRLIGENIDLQFKLQAAPGRLRADPVQIEQIILNLVLNSRDAMPEGGHLEIETGQAAFDGAYLSEHFAVSPGRYVMIAVSDSGIGMSRETRAHIFEPFFTTKEQGKGTGLGLATTYGIVRQSGGHIWLYSEPGEGTTFKAYFPLVEEDVTAPAAVPPPAAGGTETILLVEDEPSVRELVRLILERHGYKLLVATDPFEALAIVEDREAPIDLLVSDVVMPLLSGPELALRIRELRPELRTLFLSGYTEELVGVKGGLEDTDGFLSKPFTPDALARKVRELVDGQKARA
jgi:two-component system cell cycle sensor histidine kinase/response regulator CckA